MPEKKRVVIADFINDSLEIEKNVLADVADVQAFDARHEHELAGQIESSRFDRSTV